MAVLTSMHAPNRVLLVLVSLLLLAVASVCAAHTQAHALSDKPDEQPVTTGPIVVNELLSNPIGNITSLQAGTGAVTWTAIAAVTEWFELRNSGSSGEVDISGWTVTSGPRTGSEVAADGNVYQVPSGIKLPAGGFLVVMCPIAQEPFPSLPAGSNVLLARGFKIGKQGLYLYDSGGKLVATTGKLPEQLNGVSFGLPSPPSTTPGTYPYTYLASQTPWLANSGAKPGIGPFIYGLKQKPKGFPSPGQDIQVSAKLRPNQAAVKGATLRYLVNYGTEKDIPMQADGPAGSNGEVTFTATIPASEFNAGDMVRWKVLGTDTAGNTNQEPLGIGHFKPQYDGTVISIETNSTVPILYWYSQNPVVAQTQAGGASSIGFNGTLYDNVETQKRGMTALSWRKPKIKVKVDGGISIAPGAPKAKELKLNSYFMELGENSMMKEVVAYEVMKEQGVLAPLSYHVQVYLNGKFYGLDGVIEPVDSKMLQRFNLPKSGPLFKSLSGELSNLRWDLPLSEMPFYFSQDGPVANWQLLANFTKGLAGGGPGTRTSYLYDHLNLPNVINEMAVNTLLGNMDRCTKNFHVYFNPDTAEWSMVAWDVEASMGQDNLLGGAPGPYYCILACEQWNSPLYCDSEHPQDISGIQTPWGQITAVGMNPYQGSATGRRLLQTPNMTGRLMAEGTKPLTFPKPDDWTNPDRDQTGTKSVIGAAGTFNHLVDAVLDVNTTRVMYMRRLRTLADKYLAGGQLRQIIDATRAKIAPLAAADNALWNDGDASRGYQQLITEWIPIRTKQLLQYYAPGGLNPLLPGPQSPSSSMTFKFGPSDLTNSDNLQQFMSIQLVPPESEAIDMSGWKLVKDNSVTWNIPMGTVLLPQKPLHLSPSVRSFRGRSQSPKAGEAVFVLEVPQELLAGQGQSSSYTLQDAAGNGVNLEA